MRNGHEPWGQDLRLPPSTALRRHDELDRLAERLCAAELALAEHLARCRQERERVDLVSLATGLLLGLVVIGAATLWSA